MRDPDPSFANPTVHAQAHRAYLTADAFDTVGWRAPSARRFDPRTANDWQAVEEPGPDWGADGVPRWLVILIGAICAAVMGALVGGAFAL